MAYLVVALGQHLHDGLLPVGVLARHVQQHGVGTRHLGLRLLHALAQAVQHLAEVVVLQQRDGVVGLHFWPARVHDGALLAKDVLPDVLGPVRADRRQQQDLDLDEPTHEGAVVGLCGAWPGYPHAGSELAAQCGGTREEGRTRPDLMQMSR